MKLTFYSMNENKNKIGKTLGIGTDIDIIARADFNVLNPVIILTTIDPTIFNYCYIDSVNRYYFIDRIDTIRNGVYKVFMHVDVLKTYENSIKSLTADISKSENPNENFLNTDFSENINENVIPFDDLFNHNGVNVLITATN